MAAVTRQSRVAPANVCLGLSLPRPRIADMPESDRAITREQVVHLGRLARLALTEQELDQYSAQLADIVGAVARVVEVATAEVPATSHPMPLQNVFREDLPRPSLSQEQALSGAPAAEGGRFRVPRILDEE